MTSAVGLFLFFTNGQFGVLAICREHLKSCRQKKHIVRLRYESTVNMCKIHYCTYKYAYCIIIRYDQDSSILGHASPYSIRRRADFRAGSVNLPRWIFLGLPLEKVVQNISLDLPPLILVKGSKGSIWWVSRQRNSLGGGFRKKEMGLTNWQDLTRRCLIVCPPIRSKL